MYQIKFNLHSYWRAGTGRGGGSILDEVVHKDTYGLPCLPGRTVKGLLRDAVYRAEKWGHVAENTTINWFGSDSLEPNETETLLETEPLPKGETETRLETEPGALGVSDARLDEELRNYFISLLTNERKDLIKEGKLLCQEFFHQIHATSIDHKTGSAEDKSLRGMEVTIPLTLTATLYELQPAKLIENWHQELKKCLPLIRAVGTSRSRGLGRVTVEIEKFPQAPLCEREEMP
jgi:CRISPR/Cas system CSM-associated protein Csm3 (group 7 of RAMP superfamily)